MRIGNETVFFSLRRDPGRWLYVLGDLSDPLRAAGLRCYADSEASVPASLATVRDGDGECEIRFYGDPRSVCEEVLADPAVREALFSAVPVLARCYAGPPPPLPGFRFFPSERRVLDRFGCFGEPLFPARFAVRPAESAKIRAVPPKEARGFSAWDPSVWGSFPWLALSIADEDLFWLAEDAENGAPLGYLWAADAGFGYTDIVNLFVRADGRRKGTGRSLVSRFAGELVREGGKPYYGVAVSRESAALAAALGFRRVTPPPGIFKIETE